MALSNTYLGRIIRLQRDLLATILSLLVYRIFSVSLKKSQTLVSSTNDQNLIILIFII